MKTYMINGLSSTKEFTANTANYIKETAKSWASTTYNYGYDRLQAAGTRLRSSIEPYAPHFKQSAEFAGALVITLAAFRALGSISSRLPIEIIPATVVAGYSLRNPDQAARFVAIYSIGSALGKTSTLSACSLPVIQAFALYIVASTAVDYVRKQIRQ